MEQCRSLTNDSTLGHGHVDEDSLIMTSQLFLKCLDRHEHHGRFHEAYKGIIRICLAEILASNQLGAAMWEGPWNTILTSCTIHLLSIDLPLLSTRIQPLQGQLPGQERGLVSHNFVRNTSTLPEGTPLGKFFFQVVVRYILRLSFAYHMRLDVSFFSTSGSVSYEQTFQTSTPQHSTSFEGQILSVNSSTSRHQEPHLPVAQPDDAREKVKCTWPDCSKIVGKGWYNRHVDEKHLRKVKAVCARCEKTFSRTHSKMKHEPICRGRPSKSRNS